MIVWLVFYCKLEAGGRGGRVGLAISTEPSILLVIWFLFLLIPWLYPMGRE